MGAKDSKPLCISYEDAIKRVTEPEIRRIREAFKRSSGAGGNALSKGAFIQDVLCEGVPSYIADCLYTACGGTQKGIQFKELLCGLVLLTKGTHEEKIKFMWTLYSNESGTYLLKQDFMKAIQIETSHISNSTQTSPNQIITGDLNNRTQTATSGLLISLFGQSDRVTFEQFRAWIIVHKGATILSKWLLLEPYVNFSSELETPTFYQSLAGVTHLEEQDIGDLEKVFWALKGSALTGQLDLESLGPLLSPPVPKSALSGVFLAFDENRDGHIDFKELCCGVSAACRGPSVERSKFCFKVFDTDRDGILNFVEIKQMVNILTFVAKESSNSNIYKNIIADDIIAELYNRSLKKELESSSEENTPTMETVCVEPFNFNQEDFLMWSVESVSNLVQPFLDLLFEVCHIVLGLRPQCRHVEHEIVKGWLSREVRRGYKVGQFWYLISAEWWQNWLQYTQNPSAVPCSYCKLTNMANRNIIGVDEAMVCDESFTSNSTESMGDLLGAADSSSLGSGSSGISCGRQLNSPPGPIDNTNLIAPNIHKNIQTLTGEGGKLKRDLLIQHKDFELVPDSLWKALSQWYRGPLPLPRQVIQPINSPEVELELYPLNLKILRHLNTPPVSQTNTWGAVSGGYGALTTAGNYSVTNVPPALQPPKRYLAYTAAFSRLATIKQVEEFLCQRLKLKSEDVRIWHILGSGATNIGEFPCLLEEEQMTLQELMVADNDQILLEIRNKDLTWPEELGSLTLTHSGTNNQERRSTIASIQSVHPPGATGLHNLGNTCFMNAALQVLFNTHPLTQYFRQNMHLHELNTTNKLGTKGQLALRYSELLKEIWTASTRSIAPLKLRFCVTKHAPQFAGGGQHDSQELLEWLLDALHEDLNRVTEKPYSELKDSNGRADAVVAAEAWNQHHSRNQSIVIDLFYGQLKSKVSCLGCGRDSVRFDPFSLLSLPLPVENFIYCEVLVIQLDGSVPIKYGLRLNSDAKYFDLKKELSDLCNLNSELMLICELYGSQIKCIFKDDTKIKTGSATELYVYELPKGGYLRRPRTSVELNIEKGLKDIQRNQALLQMPSDQTQLMGLASGNSIHATSNQCLTVTNDEMLHDHTQLSSTTSCNRRTPKQSVEISTSPESTFMESQNNKTISTTNLLSNNNDSTSLASSLEDTITTKMKKEIRKESISNEDELPNESNNDAVNITTKTTNDNCIMNSIDENVLIDENRFNNCETTSTSSSNNDSNCGNCTMRVNQQCHCGTASYLIAVHRKLSRQDTYFLSYHKSRPSLFGLPILIPCYEGGTNKDLYCAVWVQVARLLSPLPPTPPDQSNHATDCDDSLGYEFPFTLRAVVAGGRVCALCPWTRFCRGCEIPCTDEPLLQGIITSENISSNASTPRLLIRQQQQQSFTNQPSPNLSRKTSDSSDDTIQSNNIRLNLNDSAINIAIDWDPTALHLRYQSTRERIWTEHSSVAMCRKQQTEPVDLDHCLRAFTSEEKLEQWYHCGHCKGKKPATKKLQIWKLPPILIIHLKRFNFVNNRWVKSQKVVNFPFKDFDPTSYLASVPQETILRHQELSEQTTGDADGGKERNMRNVDCSEEINEFDRENNAINEDSILPCSTQTISSSLKSTLSEITLMKSIDELEVSDEHNEVNIGDGEPANKVDEVPEIDDKEKSITTTLERRKRLISTSLTKTPVIDGQFTDYHNHKLKNGQDPFDLKYQLYAVVSHSGMLNGGHYISYAANPNGSWYCYNDSSCREIPCRPNIDPGSAYLLFYERQGLDYGPYLPKVEGRPIPNGNIIEPDDTETDLRKVCVLA